MKLWGGRFTKEENQLVHNFNESLSFDQKFVNQFEHYGKYFDDYTVTPYKSEWDQKLLVLWHPEACAAIQLLDSVCEGQRVKKPPKLTIKQARM